MTMCGAVVLWTVLVVALGVGDASLGAPVQGEGKFIWLSDLHVDPYYGTSDAFGGCTSPQQSPVLGAFGCDSPWALVQQAIAQAKATLPDPDFVLVTGDFSRHDNDKVPQPFEMLHALMHNVSELLSTTFPGTHTLHAPLTEAHAEVAISLGNNDVIPDYFLDTTKPDSKLLSLVADAFNSTLTPSELASVRKGGYLMRAVSDTLRLISLNTVIYSPYHVPDSASAHDPLGQFEWLKQQLRDARQANAAVYIVGHIPPTLGSYDKKQNWRTDRITQYNMLLSEFEDVVKAQLFGHLHSDEFRIPHEAARVVPLLIAPSVTPVYRNNPSLRIVTYDRGSGTIVDHHTRYVDVHHPEYGWRDLYSFASQYGVSDLTAKSLNATVTKMANKPAVMHDFLHVLRQGVDQGDCNDECTKEWICLFRAANKTAYQSCIDHSSSGSGGDDDDDDTNTDDETGHKGGKKALLVEGVAGGGGAVVIAAAVVVAVLRSRSKTTNGAYLLVADDSDDEDDEDGGAGDVGVAAHDAAYDDDMGNES
ncbi:hypothetical protein PTSG_05396 [Salpingoeca rosetta]|uniref:Uncharacterized protein n=1 Tax=Salpingoeca rosetta (strain ATCC 50818 / BSB-021) TaxID=946362 RepID=F2UAB3_SALR5|nr:uncharacterized protein PTSG_05396 [Salpingoeca rosetta]EGD73688.1 hypothetical protein PTSG_05396 [Salpingoeca rosetta]|eukprot:XP_004993969.1 hypothetical protein PTSG_05396 [Salpingoeca rosetta]